MELEQERIGMPGGATTGRRTGRRAFLRGLGATAAGATVLGDVRPASAVTRTLAPPPEEQRQFPMSGSHRVLWSVETDERMAALTFDDGPDPRLTPAVLRALDEAGVRATFFLLGHNVVTHPGLARAIVAAGHEVANHTATHLDLGRHGDEVAATEIQTGATQIAEVTGLRTRWFRPPRGQLSAWSIRHAALSGHDTVMWSRNGGPEHTDLVVNAAGVVPGDIFLLHDGIGRGTFEPEAPFARKLLARRMAEVEALPAMLRAMRRRGVRLGTVADLVAAERVSTDLPSSVIAAPGLRRRALPH